MYDRERRWDLLRSQPIYKFEITRRSRYEAMNGGAKYRKLGGLGWLGDTEGHGQCRHSIERIRLPIQL